MDTLAGLEETMLTEFDKANIGNIVAGEGTWFTAQLLRLIAKADELNKYKLSRGFPEEVKAYNLWVVQWRAS